MSSPTIISVTPNVGTYSGGTSVTIVGTDFLDGPAPTVTVGGASATSVVFVSSVALTCDVPAGTVGAQDVVVLNNDAGTVTSVGGFTYEDIVVTSITDAAGTYSGGTAVTIAGTGFYTGTTVTIGGASATSVVVVDENTLTLVTPAGTVGAQDVVATNLDAETDTLAGGFTYEDIVVTSITDAAGTYSGGTAVTIDGTGFYTGTTVTIGGASATSVVVVDENTLTLVTPAGTVGAQDVVATNLDAETDTLAGGFTYEDIVVTSITDAAGTYSGGTSVTIAGTGFYTGTTVTIGGASATSVVVVDENTLTLDTPAGTVGAQDVIATNLDAETDTLAGGFTYEDIVITSITDAAGSYHGETAVTIDGTGFYTGTVVTIGGASATSVVVVDENTLTLVTPAGTAGAQDVVATNLDAETDTLAGGFTYEAISITSITAATGSYHTPLAVTIDGFGFYTGTTVTIGGVAATSVVVVDENTLTLDTGTPGTAGAQDVVATNLDAETDTLAGGYTYQGVTVTNIVPDDGPTGGGTAVTITGTEFYAGLGVEFDSTAATSVVVVSPTSITAVSPAGTGVADIVVTNSDAGTGTFAGAYSYGVQSAVAVTVPAQMGQAGAGIFRSSPGLGDMFNKIADNLDFIKVATQQDTFVEFKVMMEDIDLLGYVARQQYGVYSRDATGAIQIPARNGEGRVGLNRAQTSEKGIGLKDVMDRVAVMLAELKAASQLTDFAAFKAAMASLSVLTKSDDSRI